VGFAALLSCLLASGVFFSWAPVHIASYIGANNLLWLMPTKSSTNFLDRIAVFISVLLFGTVLHPLISSAPRAKVKLKVGLGFWTKGSDSFSKQSSHSGSSDDLQSHQQQYNLLI